MYSINIKWPFLPMRNLQIIITRFVLFLKISVVVGCVCLCLCLCVRVYMWVQVPRKVRDVTSPGIGVRGSCELSSLCAEN